MPVNPSNCTLLLTLPWRLHTIRRMLSSRLSLPGKSVLLALVAWLSCAPAAVAAWIWVEGENPTVNRMNRHPWWYDQVKKELFSGAAEMVTALVLEPPQDPPVELRQALRSADAEIVRRHALTAIGAYLAIASFLPIAAWNGIRKWPEVLAVFAVALLLAMAAWRIRRRPDRTFVEMLGYAIGNGLLLALMGRMAGPFTFVPALMCVVTMSVMAYPAFIERSWILIATMIASFSIPLVLEAQGLLPTTWDLRDGGLFSHAGALVISGTPTAILVIGATVATVIVAGIHAAALGRSNRSAQQQLVMQAWHLRQLLPAARPA